MGSSDHRAPTEAEWGVLDVLRGHRFKQEERTESKPDDPGWRACSCSEWEGYWPSWQPHVAEMVVLANTPLLLEDPTVTRERNRQFTEIRSKKKFLTLFCDLEEEFYDFLGKLDGLVQEAHTDGQVNTFKLMNLLRTQKRKMMED